MKKILPYLPKPSHYLGNEVNAVHKDLQKVSVNVGLAFPDLYEVGMSYLGQKILYKQINDEPDFYAQRVFAPSVEAAQVMKERNVPLGTLESDQPLKDLDIIAFSLTHELCYTNILYMLDLAGFPLYARDRNESWPLVIAGGGATFNAEPVADFFDLMVLGDGEKVLIFVAEAVRQAKIMRQDREELLLRIKEIPGIYVPSLFQSSVQSGITPEQEGYERVFKAVVPDLNDVAFPADQVVPYGKIVHDRFSVEIARGCTRGCRFCQAGSIYRPVRERRVSKIVEIINEGLTETGLEEVSFLSLSTGDFSALEELFVRSFVKCQQEQVAISLPSLRVGSVNENLMQLIARIRRTHATLAPEAGTQRLRDVINKGITEEDLLDHTEKLFRLGWKGVKLYFMIGLPTETQEDLEGIKKLCLKVLETGRQNQKNIQVTASISPFVPKSHTPFQWERQLSLNETYEKIGYLRSIFKRHKKLTLKWHDPEMSMLEGIFARAGRELSLIVQKAYDRGQVFTSWTDSFKLDPWLEIMSECGLKPEDYLRSRQLDEYLPWDHLDCGLSKKYLQTEKNRALQNKTTKDCRYQNCRQCGVCQKKGSPSRLPASGGLKINNILNLDHRDQEDEEQELSVEQKDLTEKSCHYRVWYRKTGLSIYLSQLELQSIFERAMRRCSWPLTFSKGFRPAPVISFGQALPVGVASLQEWFNIFTRESLNIAQSISNMNDNLPSGLQVERIDSLSLSRKQAQAHAEEFAVDFSVDQDEFQVLEERWQSFVEMSEYIVDKQGKKKITRWDLRSVVQKYLWEQGPRLTITFSWENGYLSPLFVVQSILGEKDPGKIFITKQRQMI
ncbi:TIGR03960 family B12-binding radical SAM protein [Desulfonatronovibrio magnus]|uniref:TIGR03960 family B12-binding radical SAM protein n=1 Tax=Desulfonatronovibrio magnus TaxID=698827 RepID=UPI0005EBB3B9|nr:TIGR03960 family B12-binding radical SAM protein [Desulfonatronovibrio magnus]